MFAQSFYFHLFLSKLEGFHAKFPPSQGGFLEKKKKQTEQTVTLEQTRQKRDIFVI